MCVGVCMSICRREIEGKPRIIAKNRLCIIRVDLIANYVAISPLCECAGVCRYVYIYIYIYRVVCVYI